jgi:hypothetical protein
MRCERIRAVSSWRGNNKGRYDMILVSSDSTESGMKGMLLARVLRFFKITTADEHQYPCALVHWWSVLGDECDEDTGMWTASPDLDQNGDPVMAVIHLDTIVRAAHVLPVYGDYELPAGFSHFDTLDFFDTFYINKFIDHHAFTIVF